jgi:hypothetical protein
MCHYPPDIETPLVVVDNRRDPIFIPSDIEYCVAINVIRRPEGPPQFREDVADSSLAF